MAKDAESLLTREFAQTICDIFLEETNLPVILVKKDGIIFAATNKERIGTPHEIAKQVMDGIIDQGVVTVEEEQQARGLMRAGINIPIIFEGKRIAVLGISGDPVQVKPLVGLASRTIQLWLHNKAQLEDFFVTTHEINNKLHGITATIQEITAGADQAAAASQMTHEIARDSREKIKEIEGVFQLVKNLASQSNLIGLNAAIEAARVGEHGRGFAVVANEVRKLAATSQKSVEDVQAVLNEIQHIFGAISNKVSESKEVNQHQLSALQSISENIIQIEKAMSDLINRINK
jgi:sugar diacid utilization regulator